MTNSLHQQLLLNNRRNLPPSNPSIKGSRSHSYQHKSKSTFSLFRKKVKEKDKKEGKHSNIKKSKRKKNYGNSRKHSKLSINPTSEIIASKMAFKIIEEQKVNIFKEYVELRVNQLRTGAFPNDFIFQLPQYRARLNKNWEQYRYKPQFTIANEKKKETLKVSSDHLSVIKSTIKSGKKQTHALTRALSKPISKLFSNISGKNSDNDDEIEVDNKYLKNIRFKQKKKIDKNLNVIISGIEEEVRESSLNSNHSQSNRNNEGIEEGIEHKNIDNHLSVINDISSLTPTPPFIHRNDALPKMELALNSNTPLWAKGESEQHLGNDEELYRHLCIDRDVNEENENHSFSDSSSMTIDMSLTASKFLSIDDVNEQMLIQHPSNSGSNNDRSIHGKVESCEQCQELSVFCQMLNEKISDLRDIYDTQALQMSCIQQELKNMSNAFSEYKLFAEQNKNGNGAGMISEFEFSDDRRVIDDENTGVMCHLNEFAIKSMKYIFSFLKNEEMNSNLFDRSTMEDISHSLFSYFMNGLFVIFVISAKCWYALVYICIVFKQFFIRVGK